MKYTFLILSIFISATFSTAQPPGEPCCAIVGINPATNMITARNSQTGRLFMYRVSPSEISSIKLNDPVSTNGSFTYVLDPKYGNNKYFVGPVNFTQVKNETSIGLVGLNYSEPCCAIIAIENAEACCKMIAAQNRTTGEVLRFKLPAEIGLSLKNKDAVYIEPGQNNAIAIIQSSWQSQNTYPNSYSFPVESIGIDENISSASWELSPSDEVKGNLGRLNTHFEEGVEWGIDVFTNPARKPVMSRSARHRGKNLFAEMAPGIYDFRLGMVMVENVPIVKGNVTRLKAGILQVHSNDSWNLYDDSKTKFLTSGNKAIKLALPAGNYQLKINGQFYPVQIVDGQIFEH